MPIRVAMARAALALGFIFLSLAGRAEATQLKTLENCTWEVSPNNDGDSFHFRTAAGERLILRLYFVDSPELTADDSATARRLREQTAHFGLPSAVDTIAFGEAATQFTREFLGDSFTIHTAYASGLGRSIGGRVYGFARNRDGQDLGEALVAAGLARAHGVSRATPEGVHRDEMFARLRDLELVAALLRRGCWARSDPDRILERRAELRAEQAALMQFQREAAAPPRRPLNINTASAAELGTLPYIGPVLAVRIMAGRPYQAPEDLLRVSGIGAFQLNHLREWIICDPAGESTTAAP